ncbi:B12-binding domain-containing radical SAM protein [Elusimicrobiota bacterium]
MNVVFINPSPGGAGLNDATIEPPLGLAYIAAVLEQEGFSCSIIDANALGLDLSQVIRRIPKDAKIIGFYINSFCYTAVSDLTAACRRSFPGAIILLGGPLASAIPQQLLHEIPCHGVICGEGEYSVARIMRNISNAALPFDGNVPGAVFRDPGTNDVVVNPPDRIKDIDQIPFPAYHLLPPLKTYKSRIRKSPMAAIVTSRGCPHQCTFCSKDIFKNRVTLRSAGNVLAEIDYLVSSFGVRQIDILDDNFTQKRSRVEEILDGLIERKYDLALNLQSGIRSEIVDEGLFRKMKKAGVFKLAFGVESADTEVLMLCKKRLDLRKCEEVAMLAKKMGFLVYGFFVIGLPGENDEAFRKTIEFARRVDFDAANFCMAIPFVGTELYEMVKERGRFLIDTSRNIDMGFYGGKVFFEHGDVREGDVLRRYKTAYKEFFSLHKKLKVIASMRSWSELRWILNAAYFVLKGTLGASSGSKNS